ncbi:hypothetical protein [Pseudooceanicola sp. MF1-13]|uniref:hypothetical protein n=1 Tax=Pseudooceanicola sp. MF1-13 TaxID=3379095 RepID=UPI003892CB04
MSMKAVVGALRVVLGMDSAQFNKGATDAEKRAAGMRKTFDRVGRGMSSFGKAMSVGVTAPLTALVAGARSASAAMADLDNQAKVAGVGVQRFKEMSLAVKGLGVDSDQLSDILKDVNDKMGDYFQNGAGPMADFFDNIAPKVGLTAEAFKGLSSDQALLKYVKALQDANVSQSEMTFYLEALASDATALLPALINNGAAIEETAKRARELGLALDEGTIAKAREARGEFGLVADVMKTRLQAALLPLGQSFAQLAETAMPVLIDLANRAASIVEAFGNLSPEMQELIVKAGLIAAAVGPAALALGGLVLALKPLAGLFVALTSPVGAVVAAIAGLSWVIWRNREAIAQWLADVYDKALEIPEKIGSAISSGVGVVTDALAKIWEAIKAEVTSWPGRVVQSGKDLVGGIVEGIKGSIPKATSAGRNAARAAARGFEDESEINSPSRVFMRLGQFLMDGLALGIQGSTGKATEQMRQASVGISAQMAAGSSGVEGVTQSVKDLGETSGGVFERMGGWLVGLAKGTRTLRGTVSQLMSTWGSNLMRSGMSSLGGFFQKSMGPVGGGLLTGILGGLLGFADGGSFQVGGAGGIDSQLVAFKASPDETVSITKPGQQMAGGANQPGGVIELVVRADKGVFVDIARNEAGVVMRQGAAEINAALPDRVLEIVENPRDR